MSNSSPWHSPDSGASAADPQQSVPQASPPAQPYAHSALPAWTPPPKPGLIALRPMTLGTILSASFLVLRRNPRPIFGLALLITGIISIVSVLLIGLVTFSSLDRAASASAEDAATVEAGAAVTVVLTVIFTLALSLVGGSILQGIVSLEVARGALGERLKLRGLWNAAHGRLWALIGWSAIVVVAAIIVITIVSVVAALLFAIGDTAGAVLGVLAVIGGIIVGIALSAWLTTFLALVPSALMIERLPLRQAIGRSWSLVTGSFWRTFGILLLVAVIVQFISGVVTAPVSFIGSMAAVLLDPTGNDQTGLAIYIGINIVAVVISVVIGSVMIVIQSAAPALLYIDQRMRKEGFDLELNRFVEARHAGDSSVADPYLTADSHATPAAGPGHLPTS